MRDKLFKYLLQNKSITLSEYSRTYLGTKYSSAIEPMLKSTLAMDKRFDIKEGRIFLTKEAENSYFETPFVVLDVETTGVTYYDNYVIELAAVKIENQKIVDEFETFIRPPIAIPSEVSQVNGITDDMVKEAPAFVEIAQSFLQFLGKNIFVAHNANFDWRFINVELKRIKLDSLSNQKICTMELSKAAFPGLPSYSLEYLTQYFHTKHQNTHRALEDVKATSEVLLQTLPKLSQNQVKRLFS